MSESIPEPVEEPQKPKRNKKPPRVRWSLEPNDVIAVATLTFFMGLFGGLLAVWVTSDLFSQVQWGPVAAWFSGLLTVAAVGVALWQGIGNRRQAEANRRAEQAKMIPPIWAAVNELDARYYELIKAMKVAQKGISGNSAVRNVHLAKQELEVAFAEWQKFTREVDIVFEPALLTIVESHTQKAITGTYHRYDKFVHKCFIEYTNVKISQPTNFKESKKALNKLRSSRRIVFGVVRQHLLRSAPIKIPREGNEA